LYDVLSSIGSFLLENFIYAYDYIIVGFLIYAWQISGNSASIRWLVSVLVLCKLIDAIIGPYIIHWGSGYYVAISIVDLTIIYLITNRQRVANFIAERNLPVLSSFSKRATDNYKLTPNEIAIVFVASFSILANVFNLIERLIRANSQYNPMFIYSYWPAFKFFLDIVFLCVVISVAIDASRGFYNGKRKKNKEND